jgi:HAMP domain-containing protein
LRRSKLGGQVRLLDVEGTWHELTDVVNKLTASLTDQVRNIARLTEAVALGESSEQIYVDARGEFLDLKNTVNGMVARLRILADEVTRVSLEVGSEGRLGGQVYVPDAQGMWKVRRLILSIWASGGSTNECARKCFDRQRKLNGPELYGPSPLDRLGQLSRGKRGFYTEG